MIFIVKVLKFTEDMVYVRERTWGFYRDFATAEKAVLENWTDLYECNYYN
jgi:hypothetical protein